jgi:hypothetical protein
MRRIIISVTVVMAVLATAATATAAARTVSAVYYCTPQDCSLSTAALEPPPGPVFNPKPPATITAYPVTITYDPPAGVLTYSQGTPDDAYPFLGPDACNQFPPADPCSQDGNNLQIAADWTNLGMFQLDDGDDTPGPEDSRTVTFGYDVGDPVGPTAEWSPSGQEIAAIGYVTPDLAETGIRGSLAPTGSVSGNSLTYTWSSPYLKGLNLTEIEAGVKDENGVSENFLGQLGLAQVYFNGYKPVPPPPATPKIFTADFLDKRLEKVKPASITVTGDGSSFYGGRTRQGVTGGPHHRANFGRLRWTKYTQTEADATGVDWSKFGPGPLSIDRFHIEGTVKLHFYELENGVFTKLTVVEHFDKDAHYTHGTHTYHYTYSN